MADDFVGELFADKDPRSDGRVVKVLYAETRQRRGLAEVCYKVEIVAHPIGSSVGRKSTVSQHTLETRYKKVSH
jgi:hypothetical protein